MMTTFVHSLGSDFNEIRSSPEVAWSVNAGQQELSPLEDPNIQGQTIFTGLKDADVRQFQSASDLDFTGDFVYAVNAGGSEATIGDVTFSDGSIANDNIINAEHRIVEWYPDADYGDSQEDDTLETIMESIRWERSPGVSLDLEVEPGQTYKLQTLFAELWTERGFDVYMDGEQIYSNLAVYAEQGGINRKDTGVVFTHEFIAQDDQVTVQFRSDHSFPNTDNYLQAFTLEKLGAPFWLQLEDDAAGSHLEGFDEADVLVMPSLDGSGYGAANVTWTSPEDTMISLSGELWTMDDGEGDFQWRLDLNGDELTSGTLLANQFTGDEPFDIRAGAGGTEAVRNLLVEEGDEVRLTVTGSEAEFVGVEFSVATDSLQIPRFPLGEIPAQDAISGETISFFVDVSDSARDTLSVSVSGSNDGAAARASLDTNGLFTYTPSATDRFDTTVTFEAVDGGVLQSQQFTIRTNEIRSEFELVTEAGELPDAADYVVVSDESLDGDVFFNGVEREKTRRVEISGKEVSLIPGNANGLFERFVHTGGVANSDIRELSIYAETVIVGGKLWLPGTDITIYAKELIFRDENGTAEINTTPLDFQSAAANAQLLPPDSTSHIWRSIPGVNGEFGQDAGDVKLQIEKLTTPDSDSDSTTNRFVLRGGKGQQGGNGHDGRRGNNPRIVEPLDGLPNVNTVLSIQNVLNQYPNTTYIQFDDIFRNPSTLIGSTSLSGTSGGNAVAGGLPGNGGVGGQLQSNLPQLDSIVDSSGGLAGDRAPSANGGAPGSPSTVTHVRIPFIGSWSITTRTLASGRNWDSPSGVAGANGLTTQVEEADAAGWAHPTSMRAMISYAKDAYLQGHIELAAELFNEYGNLLDEAVSAAPEFAAQFTEMRSEVATYEHQLANHLDYFGNPVGWAPTLSFAANYRAFENAIESDLKTLFLTRLVQDAEADQQSKLDAIDGLISELDETIKHAADDLNDAQNRLPDLQRDLQDITVDTEEIQGELAEREAQLESQAQSNITARKALGTIGGLLSVVPIPAVSALGVGLTAVDSFVADPSIGGFVSAAQGIADPFKQEKLEASSEAISEQLDLLDLPSEVNSATLKDYGSQLAKIGAQWGPVVSAFHEVATASQVPSSEIENELQRLKAQDSEFNELIGKLENLLAKKQKFAAELAQTMNAISVNLNTITTGYATADALNQERSVVTGTTLSHSTLDRVNDMERNARDRLLRYQYNLAKAFEYETLTAYPGDFALSGTFNEIVRLLDAENAGVNFLDDPDNFAALESIYESELREVADPIWSKLNENGPQRTSEIKLTLSAAQVAELNRTGEVTINLVEEGFINAARQDVKLLQIGIEDVVSTLSDDVAFQAANVQFRFEHSGESLVQSEGTKYLFQHVTNDSNNAFFWSTDYDAVGGELTQSEVSPSDIEAVSTLLGVEAGSLRSPYAHPGARSDITIRTLADVVPSSLDVNFQELTLFVQYDSDLPDSETVLLDVRTPEGVSPRILVDQADGTGRDDGVGNFTRFYDEGQRVTLTAEPTYGGLQFAGWLNHRGETLSDDPTLTISLSEHTQLRATYAASDVRLAGDANSDGEVSFSDFLILSNNFGRASDVAFADGDFDASGEIDFADFLILSANFGRTIV